MKVSVCVPYWQRQAALDRMLQTYARLYPDLGLEFSICDDGSPEPAVVPPGVILTRLPAKDRPLNPCVPINRAVAASSGEVIVLTNPEIEHREPVLPALLELLESEDDYVAATCWDDRGFHVAGADVDFTKRGRLPVPPGAQFHFLAAFHRTLWDRAGGFDEDYRHGTGCDDNDFLFRLHRAGARFRLSPATVYHHPTKTPWGMPHNRDLFFRKWPEARPA